MCLKTIHDASTMSMTSRQVTSLRHLFTCKSLTIIHQYGVEIFMDKTCQFMSNGFYKIFVLNNQSSSIAFTFLNSFRDILCMYWYHEVLILSLFSSHYTFSFHIIQNLWEWGVEGLNIPKINRFNKIMDKNTYGQVNNKR